MYSQAVLAIEEYKLRLKDRESRVAHCEQVHIRLGSVRLVLALVAAAIAWESLRRHALSPWWTVVPLILYVFIAAYHSRILRARDLARRGVSFYRNGVARIEERWAGTGQTGERFSDPHHVYCSRLGFVWPRWSLRVSLDYPHTHGRGHPCEVAALTFGG
jgi:hypothetical protein